MKNKIKEKIEKIFDIITYKEQIKLLEKRVSELELERRPLIDQKNKYLTELRVKNLELGRLKKKLGDKE